ncbi:MAG: triose-phosphate isomerase [Rhodobacterales bacterium]|nr:MAG: triose-phosphate isomerase [Rhodobacterales bacterium]
MCQKLAAGNWKMNGSLAALSEIETLANAAPVSVGLLICPPATLIAPAAQAAKGSALAIGGQDCHANAAGAHTGDLSADMLKEAGAAYVILGHSERRADHGETDAQIRAKTEAAVAAGLTPIVCAGETLAERKAGSAVQVVTAQIAGSLPDTAGPDTVIAYEPVWAIGTGEVATPADIEEMHSALRSALTDRFGADTANAMRLLYGGSVKPSNAAEIFAIPNVDGALVGGASLKASDFSAIIAELDAA